MSSTEVPEYDQYFSGASNQSDEDEALFHDTFEQLKDMRINETKAKELKDQELKDMRKDETKAKELKDQELKDMREKEAKAKELKDQGNKYYLAKQYMDALDCYTLALEWCPDDECGRENKAVYYSNRAACHLKLEDFENVINDCTEALKIKDTYIKALIRRAEARERTEKYDLAIEDLNKVLSSQMPELTPAVIHKANCDILRLQKLHEKKMEEMKDEAIGKLKELGNSFLGHFGMSLDNFKVNQDPNGGSAYNISFNK